MQYLKIRNRGATPRGAFEYIGFTTKRDSDDRHTVGVKGSGAKFAAIAALRRNIPLWITSFDEQGSYTLTHKSKEERLGGQTVHRIIYSYVSGAEVYTNLLLDSFHDWDKPVGKDGNDCYPILREFVANAYDADREFTIRVVDDQSPNFVAAREGETIVYIAHRPEFEAVLNEPNRYFKFVTKVQPLFSLPGVGDIYPKSDSKRTRIFVRGVLRHCGEVSPSAFDYSIQDRSAVSEEGLLRMDTGAVYKQLALLVAALDDAEVAKAIIVSALSDNYPAEAAMLGYADGLQLAEKVKEAFRKAWGLFGETAVVGGESLEADGYAEALGWRVIPVHASAVRGFLKKCGITCAKDLATVDKDEIVEIPLDNLPPETQALALRAWKTYLKYFPSAGQFSLHYFRMAEAVRHNVLGAAGSGWDQIKLSTAAFQRGFHQILGTLVHEHRHCRTKKLDTDFGFWKPTDDDIADVIIRAEGLDPKTGEPLAKKT